MRTRHMQKPVSAVIAAGLLALVLTAHAVGAGPAAGVPSREMESLERGVVVLRTGPGSVFVSWRMLGTDADNIGFNLYRQTDDDAAVRLNERPLVGGTNFTDESADLSRRNAYFVRAVIDGGEAIASPAAVLPAEAPVRRYLELPLRPVPRTYVHLAWVGDLDGDGEYDFVVDRLGLDHPDWRPHLEAYKRDGTFLWSVDMGPLSRNDKGTRWNAGAATISHGHNDGATVFDLDGDGRAEVITVAARGTVFGDGNSVEEGDDVQQYVCVLDGLTGAEKARAPIPRDLAADGPVAGHMGIMYLDGKRPSVVFKAKNRRADGSFNLMTNTWTLEDGQLKHIWKWVRTDPNLDDFHQIRIVDVDSDGRDELCDGSFVIDDNGTLLYDLPGVVHGDRFHIGDLDPARPGLEGFGVQQNNRSRLHLYYYDARTGEMLRTHYGDAVADIGRGIAADIDPKHPGYEYWAFSGIFNAATGEKLADEPNRPWPNFRIWWDGDPLSEVLNREFVEKWDPDVKKSRRLLNARVDGAIDSWRDAPVFYGDIIGDWREEVIYEHEDRGRLLIYTTTIPSDLRLYTLPHNPTYRAGMTVKGYMQSHMVDFYLGHGMAAPPKPNVDAP